MNTTKRDREFDYQAFVKENPPDPAKIVRGKDARQQRLEAAQEKMTIRIDKDILAKFKKLASKEHGHEELINQVLRDWLSAKDIKELVRDELQQIVQRAFSSAQKKETVQ